MTKLSDLMKKKFTGKTAMRMLTKTKAGRIASVVLVASGIHEATKKKKIKEPLSSKLKKLSAYTAKYEGKGWKNFIKGQKDEIKKEVKKGLKDWLNVKDKTKVQKKSTGGEIIIGRGVDLDLL